MKNHNRQSNHTVTELSEVKNLDVWPGDTVTFRGRKYILDGTGTFRAIIPKVRLPVNTVDGMLLRAAS